MTFTSVAFVFFFIIVTTLFYISPKKIRWAILLVASSYFYMAFVPKYIFILFALILIDYAIAILMERTQGRARKAYLIAGIISNVGLLFVFKYFNFFNENIALFAEFIHWNYPMVTLKLLLPLGLSFHTFQSLSYIIEVYRGAYKAERHLGIYALYVLFYPQLVAGPIERPQHLLPQLKQDTNFDIKNIISGLRLMLWGFFKKLVIADRLAVTVTYVFANLDVVPGPSIFLAIIFFAFQLYADFSGYSDIARGTAQTLGIKVVKNFEQPYFARSVAEFWRRWHISLSNWFRDYFYFPLAYSRKPTRMWLYFCLIATFLVTGLWHGAGWTFVVMGALHGSYIVAGLATKTWRDKFSRILGLTKVPKFHALFQTLIMFGLVSFSWIFFRAPDIKTAFEFIGQLFQGWAMPLDAYFAGYYVSPFKTLGIGRYALTISVLSIALLLFIEYIQRFFPRLAQLEDKPLFVKSCVYAGLVAAVIVFGVFVNQQFIYFQF